MGAFKRIDPELLERAREITGIADETVLLSEGLTALIQREAARKLARMGGTMPDLEYIRRRNPWEERDGD